MVPDSGAPCTCPGAVCTYSPVYVGCWDGTLACSGEGSWERQYQNNMECPPEPPGTFQYCAGEGSCEYQVDVGCGPEPIRFSCACHDGAWMFRAAEKPPLCSCETIESESLCGHYPWDCTWSQASHRCESN